MTGMLSIEERELDYRDADGVEVSLIWLPSEERVFVRVIDTRLGDVFEVEIGDADPLDVFRHPYAYAARAGIRFADPAAARREPVAA